MKTSFREDKTIAQRVPQNQSLLSSGCGEHMYHPPAVLCSLPTGSRHSRRGQAREPRARVCGQGHSPLCASTFSTGEWGQGAREDGTTRHVLCGQLPCQCPKVSLATKHYDLAGSLPPQTQTWTVIFLIKQMMELKECLLKSY